MSVTPTIATSVSPIVPASGLRTWGDYAVVIVDSGSLIAFQLSAGKAWRIEAETGYLVQEASWSLDDTWLYYGETMPGANDDRHLYRIRRLRLADLDSWGKAP